MQFHVMVIASTDPLVEFFKVGPHCMLGEASIMGDKCSVKRSVIGRHCRIGSNVKVKWLLYFSSMN